MMTHHITARDTRLTGTITGEAPDMLLLHAGGERRHVWRSVQARLARAGFTSVAYDQRGHGESGGSVADGISAFAIDVDAMLEAHPSVQFVVGASLGGMSLLLACASPHVQTRLAGLVLVDVVPDPDPDRVRGFLSREGDGLARSPLVADILSQGPRFMAAAAALTLPVLLVRAGQKGPMSDAEVRRFREVCPQLTVAQIDAAGHLIARDAPVALADEILAFCQGAGHSLPNQISRPPS
ncbi:MAG: alpha/beta hydrolase [Pseudomonadota bacterium]